MNLDLVMDITSKLTFSTPSSNKVLDVFSPLKISFPSLKIKTHALLYIRLSLSKQSQASLLGLNYFCMYFPFN